jgi:GTPase SAR1 family protein
MKIISGKQKRAQRVVLYGVESVGKTTFASQFPKPLFLDIEQGSAHLDIDRAEIKDWKELVAAITIAKTTDFKTIVIDSIDWAERLGQEDLLASTKKTSVEDFGYGKGWIMVAERISRILMSLDELIDAGKNVVLIAHSRIARFEAPDAIAAYDRYELKLSKQSSPLVKEWADELWFMRFKTKVSTSESGKGKGLGGKERIIQTTHSAAYDAKTRSGLAEEMPMLWESVEHLFTEQKSAEIPEWQGVLIENESLVNAFLLAKGEIQEDQTWRNCKKDYLLRISSKADKFIEAAKTFIK